MNKLKEIGAFCLFIFIVYEIINNYEEAKEIFLRAFKKSIDQARIEAENKFTQKYGNIHIENTSKKIDEKPKEKQKENLQFEGKVLSYEIKNEIVIVKIKRYDNQNIDNIKTTEEKIKKESYKIDNGLDFIFSCKKRNESYLEECEMY